MTNKQSSTTALFQQCDSQMVQRYSVVQRLKIFQVFFVGFILVTVSRSLNSIYVSMFSSMTIRMSLKIEALTQAGAGVQISKQHILHVVHWCFLFLVGRVWISFFADNVSLFYITSNFQVFVKNIWIQIHNISLISNILTYFRERQQIMHQWLYICIRYMCLICTHIYLTNVLTMMRLINTK